MGKRSILIFEWCLGGGLFEDEDLESLIDDARQLLLPLATDFLLADFDVYLPLDDRFTAPAILSVNQPHWCRVESRPHLESVLLEQAENVDFIVLICPESNGNLLWTRKLLSEFDTKFLSPSVEFIALTSDKTMTCEFLRQNGIPVPSGMRLDNWLQHNDIEDFQLPFIVKPNEGEGSVGNLCFESDCKNFQPPEMPSQWRIEEWVEGVPTSVSVVLGGLPNDHGTQELQDILFFPVMKQILDGKGGRWIRSEQQTDSTLSGRANRLALKVCRALPSTVGFVGIDMVLSSDDSKDVVVEVNPRLTCSYSELRKCQPEVNIAETILNHVVKPAVGTSIRN